jgi:uncharacterized protein (TIGR02147 family)
LDNLEYTEVNILEFLDYKAYLQAFRKEAMSHGVDMAYSTIAKKIGYPSEEIAQGIFEGKERLTDHGKIYKLSRFLGHDYPKSNFFHNLVCFNEANDYDESNYYLRALNKFSLPPGQALRYQHHQFFSRWYIAVVREMIVMPEFQGDYKKIGVHLVPPIPEEEVEEAVQILSDLKLIRKNEDGSWFQASPTLDTGSEIRNSAIFHMQDQTLKLARKALREQDLDVRDISTMSMGISKKGIPEVKKLIKEFRQKVYALSLNWEKELDRVYQLNIQFFALSNAIDEDSVVSSVSPMDNDGSTDDLLNDDIQ